MGEGGVGTLATEFTLTPPAAAERPLFTPPLPLRWHARSSLCYGFATVPFPPGAFEGTMRKRFSAIRSGLPAVLIALFSTFLTGAAPAAAQAQASLNGLWDAVLI